MSESESEENYMSGEEESEDEEDSGSQEYDEEDGSEEEDSESEEDYSEEDSIEGSKLHPEPRNAFESILTDIDDLSFHLGATFPQFSSSDTPFLQDEREERTSKTSKMSQFMKATGKMIGNSHSRSKTNQLSAISRSKTNKISVHHSKSNLKNVSIKEKTIMSKKNEISYRDKQNDPKTPRYKSPADREAPDNKYIRNLYSRNMIRTASNLYRNKPKSFMITDYGNRMSNHGAFNPNNRNNHKSLVSYTRRSNREMIIDAMKVLSKRGL